MYGLQKPLKLNDQKIKGTILKQRKMEIKYILKEINDLAHLKQMNYISEAGLRKLKEFRYLRDLHLEKIKQIENDHTKK